jgi:dTMP kinase
MEGLRSHRGLFIVFEGPEGAGKSTQIRRLDLRLRADGHDPLITREPGGTPAADAIRRVILDPKLTMTPLTELLLYCASRAEHVEEVIAPALAAGRLVVSDRFAGATVAYQGYGRGLNADRPDLVERLNRIATRGIEPDLTLLLDLDPRDGLERVAARGEPDRLERADINFHRRVRSGFLQQAEGDPRWRILDAMQDEEALADAVWEAIAAHLAVSGRG